MSIDVLVDGEPVEIEEAVFTTLLDNSVAGTYAGYRNALDAGSIKFSGLVELARKGDIPYSLFFAPLAFVEAQVATKTRKLLEGVSRETFQIGSREKVQLRDVELIVRDLIRKQELLKKHDRSLVRNRIVGLLRKRGDSPEADARRLMSAISLSNDEMRVCRKKQDALDLMIERLEARQVLVSTSVQHYMPQRLTHVSFSGMAVRDTKVPYIFLAGGDHGDHQEPVGRTVFTLALMSVLVARRIFAPMTWDGRSAGMDLGWEYDVAGAMLMPAERMTAVMPRSLEDMRRASEEFQVTASAVTVRAMRLGIISGDSARSHLDQLREEYAKRPKPRGMNQIRPENAVRKYAGRELVRRTLDLVDAGGIPYHEFRRTVCLNRLDRAQFADLRRAVG